MIGVFFAEMHPRLISSSLKSGGRVPWLVPYE
jgi:hypothetical protein